MTAYTKLKTALSQHANYRRTRRAIAALPQLRYRFIAV